MLRYHPKRAELRRWVSNDSLGRVVGCRTETARAMFTACAVCCLDMSRGERASACRCVPVTNARETKTHHPEARAVEPHHSQSKLTSTPDRVRRLRTLGAHISKFADSPTTPTRDVVPLTSGMQRRTEAAPTAERKAPLPAPAVQAKLVNVSETAFEAELQKIRSDLESPLREKIRKMRTLVQIAENAIPGMVTDSIKKALNMPGCAADTEWSKAMKLLNEISAESPRVGG